MLFIKVPVLVHFCHWDEYPDERQFSEEKIDFTFNSRLQSIIVGK